MTNTIKNLFTRTQFILLASLLALVFLCAPSVQASEKVVQGESFASSVAGLHSGYHAIPEDIKASVRYKISTDADVKSFPIDDPAEFTVQPLFSYSSPYKVGHSGPWFKADDQPCIQDSERKCSLQFGDGMTSNEGMFAFSLELTNPKSAIKFTSSDPTILSCTKNTCTGKKAGKAVVTVTIPDYAAQVIGLDDNQTLGAKFNRLVKKNFTMPGTTFTWNVTVDGGGPWGMNISQDAFLKWSNKPEWRGKVLYEVYFDHEKSPSVLEDSPAKGDTMTIIIPDLKKGQHSVYIVAKKQTGQTDDTGKPVAGAEVSRSDDLVFFVPDDNYLKQWPKPKEVIIPKGVDSSPTLSLTLEPLANGNVKLRFPGPNACGHTSKGANCQIFKDGKLYKTLTGDTFRSFIVDGTPLNEKHTFSAASFINGSYLSYSPSFSIITGKKIATPKAPKTPTSPVACTGTACTASSRPQAPITCQTVGCTTDKTAPTTPTNFKATPDSATQVTLTWTASIDAGGIKGYNVYRTGGIAPRNATLLTATTFADSGLTPATTYTYTVEAIDNAGNKSTKATVSTKTASPTIANMVSPKPVTVTVPPSFSTPIPPRNDTIPPTAPTNLKAVANSSSQVTLSWSASTDVDSEVSYYVVYRNDADKQIAGGVKGTKYVDNTAKPSVSYTYKVSAFDEAGNESQKTSVTVKTPAGPVVADTIAPTVPTNFRVTASTTSSITLGWNASTDAGGLKGYNIYRGTALIPQNGTPLTTTTFTDTGLTQGASYTYTIEAIDNATNKSTKGSVVARTPVILPTVSTDTTIPTTPTNFRVTASTTASITFAWNASTDVSGIRGYSIYRDGNTTPRNPTLITSTIFTDSGLTPATTYTYTVEAIDNAGNKSTKGSATLRTPSATAVSPTPTADILPPSVPQTFTATPNSVSQITLAWGNAVDVGGIKGYNIYRNGGTVALNATPVTALKYVDTGLTTATTYTYTIEAVDNAGNKSIKASATAKTLAALDVTVPSVPASAAVANLAAVSGSGWSADLSWGASTDNVGVTEYVVKSIAPTASTLTTTTGKTFKLTGLVLTSEYTVSIQAKDARGNLGPARVVKFKLNFAGMGVPPTVQIISNTVDTTVQKVVAQAPMSVPLTSAEQSTKIETLTALMNKLIELKAMMASVNMSR